MAARGNTKTITVSFPVELAEQAEQLAKTESRTMSELFREAFRTYRVAAVRKRLVAWQRLCPGPRRSPVYRGGYRTVVDETRAEFRAANRKRR